MYSIYKKVHAQMEQYTRVLLIISCLFMHYFVSGDLGLPPSEVMEQSINKTKSAMKRKFYSTPRHTIQVSVMRFYIRTFMKF